MEQRPEYSTQSKHEQVKYAPPEDVSDVYDLAEYVQSEHPDDPHIQELCKRVINLEGIRELTAECEGSTNTYIADAGTKADHALWVFETIYRSRK